MTKARTRCGGIGRTTRVRIRGGLHQLRSLGLRLPVALLIAVVAFACLPLSPAHGETPWHIWTGSGTGVFREGAYDRGEWIYSNGIFQAKGANTDGLHRQDYFSAVKLDDPGPYNLLTYDLFGAHRLTHNGDFQLPLDRKTWPDFTGDLAELRLASDSANLFVRMEFTSMPSPDAQITTLTFAHAGESVDSRPWPANAGVRSPWQVALTLWGTSGRLDRLDTSQALEKIGGSVRTTGHVMEARVPLGVLPSGPWTLTGGSGLNDPLSPGSYWTVLPGPATTSTPGSGAPNSSLSNVWDLLFARDREWTFDETQQSDDLAGGDVSRDSETVDLSLLRSGTTRRPPLRTGNISRFFTSRLDLGDGITRDLSGTGGKGGAEIWSQTGLPLPDPMVAVNYFYLGRLQPYYMRVPADYAKRDEALPLIVYLHGWTGLPDEPFYSPVGLVDAAEKNGYLFASALGRGDYYYLGPGDVDVQEVIADVQAHYRVDPNRIYLMGHSMGGEGTNSFARRHPDLFAAVAPAEGTGTTDLYENLRNTPWFEITASFDAEGGSDKAKAMYQALSAAGYDATLLEYTQQSHEYSTISNTLPRLFRFFGTYRRNPNPPVATYVKLPGEDRPELGLAYDGAYWVSRLRAADPVAGSRVEVESFGIAHARLDPAKAERIDKAVDEGGPGGRTAAQLRQTIPAYGSKLPVENRLRIAAGNISRLRLDQARAKVGVSRRLVVDTESDKPFALELLGAGKRGVRVLVDGNATATLTPASGVLEVSVPAGKHVLVLEPTASALGMGTGARLPETGSAAAALGLLLLISGLVIRCSGAGRARRFARSVCESSAVGRKMRAGGEAAISVNPRQRETRCARAADVGEGS